jgi:hypothetical protein
MIYVCLRFTEEAAQPLENFLSWRHRMTDWEPQTNIFTESQKRTSRIVRFASPCARIILTAAIDPFCAAKCSAVLSAENEHVDGPAD